MGDLYKSRTGPHKVEANQLLPQNVEAVALWCGGVAVVEHDALKHDVTFAAINVPTRVGMVRAQEGSWVLKQPDGSFSTVPDGQFQKVFVSVVDDG